MCRQQLCSWLDVRDCSMKKDLHLIACSLVALYPFSAQALSSTPQVPTPFTMAALVLPNEYPLVGLGLLSTLFLNVSPARYALQTIPA
jgi:hypothetical protein